ncbi:MAG: TolC family protein [Alistipes sp.]|nr:TolC family protein [Alistipes sp.]
MRKIILLLFAIPATISVWSQMSLESYRNRVYAYSTELMNAVAAVDKANADMLMARTSFLPSLSASGTFDAGFRRSGTADLWGFTLQPQIEQVLYGGGAVRAAYRRAQFNYEHSQYGELLSRINVRYAADHAYWSLSAMKLYVAATNEYLNFVNTLYDIVAERFGEGYVAKGDMLQVEARLSEARYSQIALQNNYEVALHRFNNLLGRTGTEEVELANTIVDSIAMPQRITVDEMFARRPDIRMAELDILAAEQSVNVARAQYNPRITAGVRGSWQTYTPNTAAKTYLDGSFVIGLNVPIFHWGERRQAVNAAQSTVRIAVNDLTQLRRDVAQEEADGWSALTNSYSQMQSSLHNLKIASDNLSISTFSYNEGQSTILDVLQAQISWLQIYTNAITARYNYAVAVSEYMRLAAIE